MLMRPRRFCSVVLLSLGLAGLAMSPSSQAQVICIGNASPPPELPVYDQPPMPAPGYIWTPGYWGGGPLGYFWVPGTWVEPPSVGLLWTPGYWGWRDGIYVWNAGYWGPHIGFYGGVSYGFGYGGVGYAGGRWVNGVFSYNRTVNNFGSVHITNVYSETVVTNNVARVSFNGGAGGTPARPTPEEEAAAHEQHVAAVPAQLQHERTASANKELLASENHGRPAIAATAKPGEFTGKGVIAAREATPGAEHLPKPDSPAASPGAKPLEKEESRKPQETLKPQRTLKEQAEPKAKVPESNAPGEAKLPGNKPVPANTEAQPSNKETKHPANKTEQHNAEPKPSHEEAKLPGEKQELNSPRAKPPEPGLKTTHAPPPVAAGPNAHPAPKPAAKDKRPPG
jgi:WXXGXW repeat (2 copies)